jgi:Transcriptional regulators
MAIRQPVTLTQVAEAAGVSIATVSRVLNRRGQVDEHTRRRVMTSVEDLGYDADSITKKREARAEQRMFNVELLLCPLAEQKNLLLLDFMADTLRGVQSFFSRHGNVRMNLCTWEIDEESHREENELIFQRLVDADGILVIGNPTKETVDRMVGAGLLPLLISAGRQDIAINSVCFDDFAGGIMAAQYLIDRGFDRIGFLCGSDKPNSFLSRRRGVMVRTIEQLGFDRFESRTSKTSDDSDIAVCFREWLESGTCPKALVTTHASATAVVCRVLSEHGLSCPKDFSLITFDNSVENVFGLELTHLHVFPRELGVKSAQRLYQIMTSGGKDTTPYKIVLPLDLVVGNSVRNA